jgi:hypothetical protein
MFERSQMKHNSLNFQKKEGIFSINFQSLHAQSLTQIKNVFTCSKHSNFNSGQSLFFSIVFLKTKCATIPFEIGEDFSIDD